MAKTSYSTSALGAAEQTPLYVRWTPEGFAHAVEIRLDLVTRVVDELTRAEALQIEIGGMLMGELPSSLSPVLRVDDVVLIARGAEDGPIYMLDPARHPELAELKESAEIRSASGQLHRVPVGFFRSHLRPGPLLPSIADRTLLAGQFPKGDYALLLIQGREPRTASFLLGKEGHLPEQSSVREFLFDDTEFRRLPEVVLEDSAAPLAITPVSRQPARQPVQRSTGWIAGTCLSATLMLGLFVAFSGAVSLFFRPISNKLNIVAVPRGSVLRITWDHTAPFVLKAKRALLTIEDGASHRELLMDPDELKLGGVDYERLGKKVLITITLDSPGANLPAQAIEWSEE